MRVCGYRVAQCDGDWFDQQFRPRIFGSDMTVAQMFDMAHAFHVRKAPAAMDMRLFARDCASECTTAGAFSQLVQVLQQKNFRIELSDYGLLESDLGSCKPLCRSPSMTPARLHWAQQEKKFFRIIFVRDSGIGATDAERCYVDNDEASDTDYCDLRPPTFNFVTPKKTPVKIEPQQTTKPKSKPDVIDLISSDEHNDDEEFETDEDTLVFHQLKPKPDQNTAITKIKQDLEHTSATSASTFASVCMSGGKNRQLHPVLDHQGSTNYRIKLSYMAQARREMQNNPPVAAEEASQKAKQQADLKLELEKKAQDNSRQLKKQFNGKRMPKS